MLLVQNDTTKSTIAIHKKIPLKKRQNKTLLQLFWLPWRPGLFNSTASYLFRLHRGEMCLYSNYVQYRSGWDKSPENKQNSLNFGVGLKPQNCNWFGVCCLWVTEHRAHSCGVMVEEKRTWLCERWVGPSVTQNRERCQHGRLVHRD